MKKEIKQCQQCNETTEKATCPICNQSGYLVRVSAPIQEFKTEVIL